MRSADLFALPRCSMLSAGSAAHMAYLLSQDRLFRQVMGTALLKRLALAERLPQTMLDIGCGVGGWTLDIARQYPTLAITGIDRSQDAIAYARAQASTRQVSNATFTVMDARTPLLFSEQMFDSVVSRLLVSSFSLDDWLPLLHECVRVTRPGGVICLTGYERGSSSSPALEELTALFVLALKLAGHSGAPDGRTIGMAPLFGRFLRAVGCQHIQYHMDALDYSQGTPLHAAISTHLEVTWPALQAWLLALGLTTPATFRTLSTEAQRELQGEDFCGLWPCLAVCGIAPGATRTNEQERCSGTRKEAKGTTA